MKLSVSVLCELFTLDVCGDNECWDWCQCPGCTHGLGWAAVIEWEGRQQPGRGDGGGDSSGWSSG